MADLYVKKFDMINPFVVASSPATQGALNVLKSAKMRPGAIVLRNYGHGSGGGSFIGPDSKAMFGGEMAIHSHAVGRQIPDSVDTLEKYCEEVHKIKKEMDSDIKLWVSVGHYSDIVKGGDWEKNWAHQAEELALAGADAIELHFNTPGVAVAKDRTFAYHQLLRHSIELMKKTVPNMPIMAKLAIESTDALTSMRIAEAAGAAAAGPTARWKGYYMDLDWRGTEARPGAGYGGTQATPLVCYSIAEARTAGYRDCIAEQATDKQLLEWFSETTLLVSQEGPIPQMTAVQQALERCFADLIDHDETQKVKVEYRQRYRTVVVEYTNRSGEHELHPMYEMSDGYRSVLSMVADIAHRMAVLNPQLGDAILETPGIIVIDEVELHLHPGWRKRILKDLTSVFPNIQFIVSTYSPEVITSYKEANLILLKHEGSATQIESAYGKDVNTVFRSILLVRDRPTEIEE